MNLIWQQNLVNFGAVIENQQVVSFGNPEKELEALKTETVLIDLSNFGLIQFAGEDTQTFLQGQLTNDVRAVTMLNSQYSGYCSPKGRMLASFLLWQNEHGYVMQLPLALRESVQKRLTMYVMRSKVKVSDISDEFVRLGVAGNNAMNLIKQHYGDIPQTAHGVMTFGTDTVINLSDNRFEIITTTENAAKVWGIFRESCTQVGSHAWEWLEIQAGVPRITADTQEQFIPQMVNFEAIGGVSFKKGCYPGQEIVARTQYLGKLKRRMYRAHIDAGLPVAGNELFSQEMDGQATGMIVNAHPSPDGGYDLLAVIQISSAENETMHLQSLDGPALTLLALPYAL